jgi:hypothetical protein
VNPHDPRAKDDRITLVADDGSFEKTMTVKDDAVAGDEKTTLRFSVKDAAKTYSVRVDPGREAKPYWLVRRSGRRSSRGLDPGDRRQARVRLHREDLGETCRVGGVSYAWVLVTLGDPVKAIALK